MPTIDEIDIKIKAESKTAAQKLDNTIEKLEQTKKALDNVGTSQGFKKAINNADVFKSKLKGFGNAIKSSIKIDDGMSDAFAIVGKNLKNSFKTTAKIAKDTFQSLGNSIKDSIKIDDDLKVSFDAVEKNFKNSLFKSPKNFLSDFKEAFYTKSSKALNLEASQKELYYEKSRLSGILDISKSKKDYQGIDEAKSKLKELDKAIKQVNEEILTLNKSELKLSFRPFQSKKINDDITGYFKNNGQLNENQEDSSGGGILTTLLSYGGKAASVGFDLFGSGLQMLKKGFKGLTGVLSDLLKPLTRTFKMLRLMFVRTVLHGVVTLTKDGFKNLVQYSDEFNDSISLMYNSIRQLSNAFAAAASPIIINFGGVIDNLIQKIIDGVNQINQFISAMLGFKTWTKAIRSTDSYRDSLDKATGSAKALKRQLQGFDELNNITTSSSGGSGGSSDTDNGKFMFTTEDIDSGWLEFVDKMKDTWNQNADFTWLGKSVSDKIVEQLGKINWTEIKSNTIKIATSIATFLNGAINPESFGAIGQTIGNALTTAIYFAETLVEEFDWENFGTSLGTLVNNAVKNIDWYALANTISELIEGILETIVSYLNTVDVEVVVTAITDFIKGIDWVGITGTLASLMTTVIADGVELIFEGLSAIFADGSDMFDEVGLDVVSDIFDGISDALEDYSDFVNKTKKKMRSIIREAFGLAESEHSGGDSIGNEIGNDTVDSIWSGFTDKAESLKIKIGTFVDDNIIFPLTNKLSDIPEKVSITFASIVPTIMASFDLTKLIGFFDGVRTSSIDSFYSTDGHDGVAKGIGLAFGKVIDSIENNLPADKIKKYGDLLRKAFTNSFYSTDGHDGVAKTVGSAFYSVYNSIKTNLPTEKIKNYGNALRKTFIDCFYSTDGHDGVKKSTGTIFGEAYDAMKNGFKNDSVKSYFTTVVKSVKTPFSDMSNYMYTTFHNAWNNVQSVFSKKGKIFEGIQTGIANTFASIVNSLIDGINSVISQPFNTLNTALTKIRNTKIMGLFHFSGVGNVSVPTIPKIGLKAKGDYDLEDGWFRANHGEIMGQFDDGTSVVANNQHIIEGISKGVNQGMQSANREQINLLYQQNMLLQKILEKETGIKASDIFNAVQNENQRYYNQTGASAFVL